MQRATAIRFGKYLLGTTAAVGFAFALLKWIELERAAKLIVERYSRQIEALTQFAIERPSSDSDDDLWEAEAAARKRFAEELFSDDAFDGLSISTDGHHGIETIKMRKKWNVGGITWTNFTPFAVEGAEAKHRINFGWSTAGDRYYVYEARVPDAKYVRHFEFWIHRTALD